MTAIHPLVPHPTYRPRRLITTTWVALGIALALGLAIGAAVTFVSPFLVVGALLVCLAAPLLLSSTRVGLLAVIGVITLLPFAVIPLRIGVQATLLDATLGTLLIVWTLGSLNRRERPILTSTGFWLACFLVVIVAAFVLATGRPSFDELTRRVIKLMASLALLFVVINEVRRLDEVRLYARILVASASVASVLAIAVWLLPQRWQIPVLSSLGVLGYPTGDGVIRFLPGPNDTYTETIRAVGTSIDPNVLGGMLMMAAALTAAHLFGRRPLAPRPLLAVCFIVLAAGMALSQSRSSWLGLAAAVAFLAAFRSRKVLALMAVGGALLLLSPYGQVMVDRVTSGFGGEDKAAALRFQEYANAFEIIQRYPVLGIGFGEAPELDLHEGVSSVYLTVAEQTGLIGLALFLLAVASAALGSLSASRVASDPQATSLSGFQAALVAALVAGFADHYFVNKDFPHMVALFWLYVGLLVVTTRLAFIDRPTEAGGGVVGGSATCAGYGAVGANSSVTR